MKSLKSTLEYLLLPIIFLLKLNKQTNLLALFAVVFMLSGTQSFAIGMGGGTNDAPVAEDDSVTTNINQSILIDVMANDTDPNDDSISITQITVAPSHGTATIEDGKIRYTPESGYEGVDSFEYEIEDDASYDSKTDTAEVTIAVQEGNNPIFQNEYSCGVFGSVLISYEQIQMGQNDVYNACEISVKDLNFDEDTNGVDVTCYSDTGDTKCSCTDTNDTDCSNDGTCTIVPEPDNTYSHTFVATTVTTSTTTSENIEFTELEYGSYRFDGNNGDDQEIYFNPQETYADDDTKVMLLGDFSFAGNGQTLTFEGGDYYFESFQIDSDGNGNINQINLCAKENIRIFVHEDFVYSGNHLNDEGCGGKIFVYVEGDATVDSNGGGSSDIPLFLYVEGDVNIQPSGDSNGWLGAITAEGAINITKGNSTSNFNFTYDDSAEEFGMGECQMCYTDIIVSGMSFDFGSCPGGGVDMMQTIVVPIEATDPLTDVSVTEVHDSEFSMTLMGSEVVQNQDGEYVRDAESDEDSMGVVSGGTGASTTTYNLGDDDGNYGATDDDNYQQLYSSSMVSINICEWDEGLNYVAEYNDGDKHYSTILSQCEPDDEPSTITYLSGPFDAWDTFRDNDDTPPEDRNISTKIIYTPFKLSLASLNLENDAYETKKGEGSSIEVAIYAEQNATAISNTFTFDANDTAHISESSDFNVTRSAKIAYVGFRFCATYDGSLYTLYSQEKCSGSNQNCDEETKATEDDEGATWHVCYARDQLAIRPEKFDILNPTFAEDEEIDLLRSGKDYNFTINAVTLLDSETKLAIGYDQNKTNLDINATILDKNGEENDNLEGTLTFGESDFHFEDGNSTDNEGNHEVVGLSFDNVANVHIKLTDKEWAAVDNDDTPTDCNGGSVNGKDVPYGTYVCGEKNATFIPDHFTLKEVNASNRNLSASFTYLSSDLNMSAHIGLIVEAMNAKGDITTNFKENDTIYYENPVEVNLSVLTTVTFPDDTTKEMTPKEQNIRRSLLGFGGNDNNGTHEIKATDNRLLFNYERDANMPINPFEVNGTDVNVSVDSIYSSSTGKTATIKGDSLAQNVVTFLYARTKATKALYTATDDSVNTPIKVEVYCNQWPTSNRLCPKVDPYNTKTNDHKWFISTSHVQTNNDGNITLKVNNSTEASIDPTDVNITNNGINKNIEVKADDDSPRPMSVEITLDESDTQKMNTWLVYDPTKTYKVKFLGTMDWAGHGKTGNVVDNNSSYTPTQRLGW